MSEAVRRARAGLSGGAKPVGSFLFVGPTGVGKTELAKALAETLFDDEQKIVRVDMSEYMEKHSVSRLIGAPPGYVGYEEGGYLTEAVRREPYSVVLMDEIEKAHPDVFNILLQILDDGRLTDGKGRTVDFTNTIVIMTSNLGTSLRDASVDYEGMKSRVMEAVRSQFKPEFLNRLDDIIVFHPLSDDEIRKITELQIGDLRKRLEARGVRHRRRPRSRIGAGPRGLRPRVRRASAQTAHPEAAGEQDRDGASQRRIRGGRRDRSAPRQGRDRGPQAGPMTVRVGALRQPRRGGHPPAHYAFCAAATTTGDRESGHVSRSAP